MKKKKLIAYFSRAGRNYVNGEIVKLDVGNTEVIALKLANLIDADLFHICPTQSYPDDYAHTSLISRREMRTKARPTLAGTVDDMSQYDTVILGFPNWWGTMPMCVHTFLESYDFSGMKIVPFCTNEGGDIGESTADIRALCPQSTVTAGVSIRGGEVEQADEKIQDILTQLGEH